MARRARGTGGACAARGATALLRGFFQLASPAIGLLALTTVVGLASVLWYEGVKGWKRRRNLAP